MNAQEILTPANKYEKRSIIKNKEYLKSPFIIMDGATVINRIEESTNTELFFNDIKTILSDIESDKYKSVKYIGSNLYLVIDELKEVK
jgi:hypothetical protein